MTHSNTTTELAPDVAATLAKLNTTLEQIRDLTEDAETYKSQLRNALPAGAYTVDGKPAVSITPTRRFSPDRAAEILPAAQLASVQRLVVDTGLAKQNLPPALFELCSIEAGKPTVRLA